MPVNITRLRTTLQALDWKPLFIEVLKWSRTTERPWRATVDGHDYTLTPIAQMADMHVYVCTSDSGLQPAQAIRRQVENQVKERRFEHIIIFEDAQRQQAIFQWIKRGQGAARSREFTYNRGQSGDLLIQRLSGIAFDFSDLDAEGQIDIAKVTARVAKSLDIEGVTKKFYDLFTKQRDAFQKFLQGIPVEDHQRWYVSVMLNRLMFVYFIQAKHFLNNDPDYLRNKLTWSQANLGPDRFYRDFLRVLFFEGFAHEKGQRSEATRRLLGDIPYLNGGLFVEHQIEETYGESITIPDAAFAKLFEFFGSWRWHLSERPGVSDREIDPDVLGYIFEKYINQKQMGAYYTKEDITGYICRNTIIPALFDKANLSLGPLDLPKNSASYLWPALKQLDRLPTETDREYAARQARVHKLIADAQAGAIATVNDAITANLNLEAMIFDLVPFLDAHALHRLYLALAGLSILDPTCGSGAFLFAAIKILKPIYEQVLDRMALLVERRKAEGMPFREILQAEQAHANRDYFITKSIVVRNLYGVDLMEEATEICKLRLFLRLVADLEDSAHVEPLPDIDFNIRAGNALVGYASVDEIGGGYKGGIAALPKRVQKTIQEVEAIQRELSIYRTSQLQLNPSADVFRSSRQSIRDKIGELNKALDADMLKMGQIHAEPGGGYNTQPFHWFTAFFEILSNGGFDVIVGNPPWVEYRNISKEYKIFGYSSIDANNLWAFVTERSLYILRNAGRLGLIVPMSLTCTERMVPIQKLLLKSGASWISNYESDSNPGQLFDEVKQNVSVLLHLSGVSSTQYTSRLFRFFSEAREFVFPQVHFIQSYSSQVGFGFPKISEKIERQILDKLFIHPPLSRQMLDRGGDVIYVHRIAHYYIKCFDFVPYFRSDRDGIKKSEDYKEYMFEKPVEPFVALINSSIFYFYWQVFYDSFKAGKQCVESFPCAPFQNTETRNSLIDICNELIEDMKRNSTRLKARYSATGNVEYDQFYPRRSKHIMDKIDRIVQTHYGFTDEELDYIINYDIKYRMGRDASGAGDDE